MHIAHPRADRPGRALINVLDLLVDGPGGRVFANGGTSADRKNNVEAVRLETAAAGTYVISVVANRVNTTLGVQPFALVATRKQEFGAGQNNVKLGQANAGTLHGVLFADINRNGERNSGEPGFAGAAVVVCQTGSALTRQLTSDATGAYVAANLPAGSYSITVVLRPAIA